MRILFITRKYPPRIGGMEEFSAQLVRELRARPDCTIEVLALGGSQLNLLWFLPWAAVRAMWSAWHGRVDVVHLGDALLCGVGWATRLANRRVPIVITAHGLDLTYRNPLYQLYLRACFRPTRVVCVSKFTASLLPRPGLTSLIIPNGVVTPKHVEKKSTDGAPLRLISVGRLVRRKGIAWFLRQVFPLLPASTHYDIVGAGTEQKNIARIIREKKFGNRVTLHGRVDADHLNQLFAHADIAIMPNQPSPHRPEGFGIAALEAGSHGLPVIASRIEGIPGAIQHAHNGLLVTADDPSAWRDAISSLATDATARKQLGDRAHAYNSTHFSWHTIAAQYAKLYQQLV